MAQFYDPSVIEVLIKRGNEFKGEGEDRDIIRDSAMSTMIKLMRKDQVDLVEKTINEWAPKKDQAKLEKKALEKPRRCSRPVARSSMLPRQLEEAAVQEKDEQFQGIKSAYMLGILGNDKTRMEIVNRFPKIKNAAIKFTSGQALDHLAPKGDKESAEAIDKQLQVQR